MARPVSPHSALPAALALPDDYERVCWVPLLANMLGPLGLTADVLHVATAREQFEAAESGPNPMLFNITLFEQWQLGHFRSSVW